MLAFTPLEWSLLIIGGFGNGFLKRTFGAGIGITLMPILTTAFSARFSLAFMALCTLWVDFSIARSMWSMWNRRFVILFFPGLLIGVACGGWILIWIPEEGLRALIGALCLLMALYQFVLEVRGRPPSIPRLPVWVGFLVGPFSGISATVANAGATILMPILVGLQITPLAIVGTIWALFLLINPFRLTAYWNAGLLAAPVMAASVVMVPAIWIGVRTGAWLQPKIPQRAFNLSVLTIALVGSARLLLAG